MMQAKVSILRISPEVRYWQPMSHVHKDATDTVHSEFHTRAGRYSSHLYDDEWTDKVGAIAQRVRLRVAALTNEGLATTHSLPDIQREWRIQQEALHKAVEDVRQHWSEVIEQAKAHLGGTFDAANYPANGNAWDVTARLHVQSAQVPAELDATTTEGLKTEAEAALRDELLQRSEAAIQEVKDLVARTAASKRAEVTRKAAIKRVIRLRRINLLADPAYDAVCSEALRELQGGSGAKAAKLYDIDFANPFGG